MAKICAVFFAAFFIFINEFRAEETQDFSCKESSLLTLSGVKYGEGLWNTSFILSKWNATNNWTLLVEHTVIETAGKQLANIRGYLADGRNNVTVDGMKRIWTCDSLDFNGISNLPIYNGPKILKDFGIISFPKWNITNGKTKNSVKYWQTTSDCRSLESCRSKLFDLYKEQMSSKGRILDNFHVLPDGNILEGLGWNKIYEGEIRINLISKKTDVFPTREALEAFAFLLQVGVSLGKVEKEFYCSHPPHTASSVDSEVRRWGNEYKNSFDSDLSLSRVTVDGDIQVVSRLDWNAIKPIRELDTPSSKVEVIEVLLTTPSCSTYEDCAKAVRDLQRKQLTHHSDIFSNFIFGGDGRIYEGLGWNWSRKNKVIYFDFLVASTNAIPWNQVLTAFSLQLREGILLGKISEKYTINMPSNVNRTVSARIMKWGEWARNIIKENVTVTFQTISGDESIVSRIDNGNLTPEKEVNPLEHPIETVLFTQSNAVCDEPRNCVPFFKRLGVKSIRSTREVNSNFYFAGDGIVYEGLGWDQTTKENEVILEFLTVNSNTLPSNRSMVASTFLISEGVKKGYLPENYHIMVGKHTSIEFENLVRFWDTRIREA